MTRERFIDGQGVVYGRGVILMRAWPIESIGLAQVAGLERGSAGLCMVVSLLFLCVIGLGVGV